MTLKKKFDKVYQFKIALKGIKPPIWRRIKVPETYTFWDLHVAIQDSMGWLDYHLHHFEIPDPLKRRVVYIGIPDEDMEMGMEILPGWEVKIADYFFRENNRADYMYDYGDDWKHRVELEEIQPREKGVKYPVCIDGQRSCPPEDCGGTGGYEDFLKIIMDPQHEQYRETLDWVGGEFDPEHFDAKGVYFYNPKERLTI